MKSRVMVYTGIGGGGKGEDVLCTPESCAKNWAEEGQGAAEINESPIVNTEKRKIFWCPKKKFYAIRIV